MRVNEAKYWRVTAVSQIRRTRQRMGHVASLVRGATSKVVGFGSGGLLFLVVWFVDGCCVCCKDGG